MLQQARTLVIWGMGLFFLPVELEFPSSSCKIPTARVE